MMRKIGLVVLITLLGAFGGWRMAHAQKPIVRAALFYASTCPHCQYVLQSTLPLLQHKYGSQLDISLFEVNEPANYEVWLNAVEMFHVPYETAGVPMLFIGDNVLIGDDEIPERLPGLIEKYLITGGIDLPPIPGLIVETSLSPTPTQISAESAATSTPTLTPQPNW